MRYSTSKIKRRGHWTKNVKYTQCVSVGRVTIKLRVETRNLNELNTYGSKNWDPQVRQSNGTQNEYRINTFSSSKDQFKYTSYNKYLQHKKK